jgi:hypothetical protein
VCCSAESVRRTRSGAASWRVGTRGLDSVGGGTYGRLVPGPVQDASPSPAFLKVFNPVVSFALRSRLAPLLRGFALARFRGRRTGRSYEVVVTWHELDGQVYVVTPARWRANFAGGAPMTMRHLGVDVPGRGVLETDPEVVADVVARLLARGESPRAFALKMPADHRMTAADMAATNRAIVTFHPAP